jgi:hypothetical protein
MKRLALLGLCVIMGIVACTGASSAAPPPSPTVKVTAGPSIAPSGRNAAAVATNYYRAIVGQKYRSAYTYLAANVTGPGGRKLTLPAFLQLARMMDGMGGPVTHFSVAAFPSTIVLTLDRKKFGPYHAHLQMARQRGGWTITSIDRI